MAKRGNSFYLSNQGKLAEDIFVTLPLGSIKVKGWLNNQLVMLRNGLTEDMEKYPDYSSTSGWLGGDGEDWERGPYYVRGLVTMAYQLKDNILIDRTQKWIDYSINSQDESGFFGPKSNTDWWPRMPMLMAIRDYYDATGESDTRVLPFMENYFRYQEKMLPSVPLDSWAKARGGDNMDSVYWLYNKLYDEANPEKTDWLLDLATLIKSQTQDWTYLFSETTVREHVVNTSQAMKMPVVAYQGTHNDKDKQALKKGLFNMGIDHGRIDELPNSDEAARDNKPTRGTELCSIAEGMLSTEIAMRILGEGWIGDHLETLAYNALPAAYSPDYLSHVYYILQNQVLATRGHHGFDCDHGDSSAFGAPCGFDCCFSNNHMAWPKFFQNMWMATSDNGLALIAYGCNEVSAKVADGQNAVFIQKTDYPFRETVEITYEGDNADFPLWLRVPEWCKHPSINLNGEEISTDSLKNSFLIINRKWCKKDLISIKFPMDIELSRWYNGASAVKRGAVIYSLKIKENWVLYSDTDNASRELKVPTCGQLKNSEVFPDSRWNYGLVLGEKEKSFKVIEKEISEQPFSYNTAPVEIITKGQIIPEWKIDGNVAGELPFGTIPVNKQLQTDITLIPYASARLKITQFPTVSDENNDLNVRRDVKCENDIQYIKNVVVPPAKDYDLFIDYEGRGELTLTINGRYNTKLLFNGELVKVENLNSLIKDKFMQFNSDNFNQLYFEGRGVKINQIKVDPKLYEFKIKATKAFEAVQLEYMIIPEATEYTIVCDSEVIKDSIISNKYKGGTPFESDKYSLSLNEGEYSLQMIAYKDKTEICKSNVIII